VPNKSQTSDNVSPVLTTEEFAEAYVFGLPLTTRFLRYRGASEDAAEEMSHAAWVRGWECLDQLKQVEMIIPWVNSIAKHMLTDAMRRQQKHQQITEQCHRLSPSIVSLEVSRILAACSTTDRFLLNGTYLEGRSTIEVAKQLGLTPINVRVRLCRLRKSLQSQIAA
jgi:RNA polymerase sigma factor (sigma-70 family)